MSNPRLSLRGISVVRSGRPILEVDSLDVFTGEVFAAVGPNGAGKSTLVQVLALLSRPARGEVRYDGELVHPGSLQHRRRMAVVFQEPLLLDTTVEGNVGTGLALRGVPSADRKRRASDWLERFGISALAGHSARTLSGGEAQRTSLARALVLEPDVLLLDEPFSALDAPTRATLIDDLQRLIAAASTTTVLVTHDRNEALRLADRVGVLMSGHIRQVGTPSDVFGSPVDEEVANFVGVEVLTPGHVRSLEDGVALVDVAGLTVVGGADVTVGDEVLVCLRPEDVVLGPPREGISTSARNHLSARVTRLAASGPYIRVDLDAGFPLVSLITKHALEELGLSPGSEVVATFKAAAVHLIRKTVPPRESNS